MSPEIQHSSFNIHHSKTYYLHIEPKKNLFDFNLKESPVINGDGTHSRDFTYIDNVLQMNELALSTTNPKAIGEVFNTAVGERADLNKLLKLLKKYLSEYDSKIESVEFKYAEERKGDIPHSLASIEKAKCMLGYEPSYNLEKGLKEAVEWYWENLK